MLNKFRSLLAPPMFADDEVKTRTASVLNTLLLSLIFSLGLIGIVNQFERLYIFIVCLMLTIVVWLIMRRGHVRLASFSIVIGLFVLFAIIVPTTGGVQSVTYGGFLVVVLLAGLLLGRWAAIAVALFASLLGATLLGIEALGIWKVPSATANDLTFWIVFTAYFLVSAVILTLALQLIDEGFRKAKTELAEHMLVKERETYRRMMMEKVIEIGKVVTEQTSDFHAALYRIWDGVRNSLGFDRAAVFLYNPDDNMMRGSYGTNRSGEMSEEWDLNFSITVPNSFFRTVLSQPDRYYFTQDYAGERNLNSRPGHPMERVKYYAAVACWSGDKPVGIICVDQLTSGRAITEEQLEALRLFAGYAGLAIENARLNAQLGVHMQERENFIKELGNRNAELERFTYTVSHDLKSPLVTIRGFLGMLKKDMVENRQDRVQKDFERISEAAEKMGVLLSELLELSRVGRITNPPTKIDLANLIQEALETLDGNISTHNVKVIISPGLPIVYADHNRLREVFENLIGNAAKYMGDQPNPLIEVGKRENETETIIYIKDNGIGIDPLFQTKIFGLFEKLNPNIEGTGIGLALVKRIIEAHGGRIWVESEGSGKGSTFCFTVQGELSAEKEQYL